MDTQKYYYLKLKDNYFEQDNIKVLESLPNGYLYSLIILKLYLKACKYNGHLKMTDSIPYDPKKINILAQVINHDKDNVQEAIKYGIEFGIITILESGEMWMTEIQNYIGHSSNEADRKREYRLRLGQMSGQISDKSPPEIEIERETKKEINIDTYSYIFKFWNNQENLIKHKKIDPHLPKIKKALKNFDVDEIEKAIEKYNRVKVLPDSLYAYSWVLKDFLDRGLIKFATDQPDSDYVKKDFNKQQNKIDAHTVK